MHVKKPKCLPRSTSLNSKIQFQLMELTLYVTDLEVLCVGQRGDVDLCTRVLLDVAHKPPLLPNQPPDQELGQQRK